MPANNDQNFEDFLNKAKSSSRTKWVVVGLIVLFFAALIFVSIDWVFGALVHTRKEVSVPDITKKSITQALNMLATNNLAMKQAGVEFAQDVPPLWKGERGLCRRILHSLFNSISHPSKECRHFLQTRPEFGLENSQLSNLKNTNCSRSPNAGICEMVEKSVESVEFHTGKRL